MNRHDPQRLPSRLQLRRDRRGAAIAVIVLLVLAVSGLGLLTLRQGQQSVRHGYVSTDSQRALAAADASAAGAVKVMPLLLDSYLMAVRNAPNAPPPPIYCNQFDANFFGDDPFGSSSPRDAECVVQILEIADDAPAPGYSEGGGCFKRITMLVSAFLVSNQTGSSDITQNLGRTQRDVVVRGLFGPVNCQ